MLTKDDIRNFSTLQAKLECGFGYHTPEGIPREVVERYLLQGATWVEKYYRRERRREGKKTK